jgi:prepilin-type N-terminal cleavage/methylation domain-containing protein
MGHLIARSLRRLGGLERARRGNAGFTVPEMLIVVVVIGTVSGIALFALGGSVRAARARGAVAQLKNQIANARELAISQQRDIRIEFTAPSQIRVVRINRPIAVGNETVLVDVRLEGGMTFQKFGGMPETPDAWGGDAAIAFGTATSLRFRSGDGALIDQNDASVNGRVFLGHVNGGVDTAGVVSVFGPTGRLRAYRLAGGTWSY